MSTSDQKSGLVAAVEEKLIGIDAQLRHVMMVQSAGDTDARRERQISLMLQARLLASHQRDGQVSDLSEPGFRVYSQWTEDGIVEWLVERLPGIRRSFVEFGVENFREANCRFLMLNRNWRGLVLDGGEANIADIEAQPDHWRYALDARAAFITCDNINGLLADNGMEGEIGILSIDVDGNDYWIWQAVDVVSPAIVICEFNSLLGDLHPLTIPYDPDFSRFEAHYSGGYFGCSIQALLHLARKKGYTFVGTGRHGVNAFFVRSNLSDRILADLGSLRAYPARHRDGRDRSGRLSYPSAEEAMSSMGGLPLVNVVDEQESSIAAISPLASETWLRGEPVEVQL